MSCIPNDMKCTTNIQRTVSMSEVWTIQTSMINDELIYF